MAQRPSKSGSELVTSVAGKIGSVVLDTDDISGLGDSATLNVGTTIGTVAAGNAIMFSKMGNVCRVDAVFGNDSSASRNGLPFLTIEGAIDVALAGDTVWILPGTYNLSAGITIPDSVVLNGISVGAVTLQMLLVTSDTTLITMGTSSVIENMKLKLTSAGHHTLIGVSLPGTTTETADIQNVSLTVDNSGASNGGTSNIYGIRSSGIGQPSNNYDCLVSSHINVISAGLGNKRGILLDTSANTFSCRDVNIHVSRVGSGTGSYIGVETNVASCNLIYKTGSISGSPTADISQTLGTLMLGIPNVFHETANGLGFSTILNLPQLDWGDNGSVTSGTRYMYRGNATASASNEPKTRFPQKAIVLELTVRAAVGPGSSRTDTWTVRKNGVNTALVGSLFAAATNTTIGNISVSFAAGDDISIEMVCAAGSTTSDVQVTVSYA